MLQKRRQVDAPSTRLESMILVGALSRLDAIQNPVLPIYRTREELSGG